MKRPHYDIIIAWANGAELQYADASKNVWVDCEYPTFFKSTKFRIKPIKPSINWEHVNPKFKWLAVDEDGAACLYAVEPNLGEEQWIAKTSIYTYADCFSSYQRGNCDWKESLVQRPEGDDK